MEFSFIDMRYKKTKHLYPVHAQSTIQYSARTHDTTNVKVERLVDGSAEIKYVNTKNDLNRNFVHFWDDRLLFENQKFTAVSPSI